MSSEGDKNFRAAVRKAWDEEPKSRGKAATLRWQGMNSHRGVQVNIPVRWEKIASMVNPDADRVSRRGGPTGASAGQPFSLASEMQVVREKQAESDLAKSMGGAAGKQPISNSTTSTADALAGQEQQPSGSSSGGASSSTRGPAFTAAAPESSREVVPVPDSEKTETQTLQTAGEEHGDKYNYRAAVGNLFGKYREPANASAVADDAASGLGIGAAADSGENAAAPQDHLAPAHGGKREEETLLYYVQEYAYPDAAGSTGIDTRGLDPLVEICVAVRVDFVVLEEKEKGLNLRKPLPTSITIRNIVPLHQRKRLGFDQNKEAHVGVFSGSGPLSSDWKLEAWLGCVEGHHYEYKKANRLAQLGRLSVASSPDALLAEIEKKEDAAAVKRNAKKLQQSKWLEARGFYMSRLEQNAADEIDALFPTKSIAAEAAAPAWVAVATACALYERFVQFASCTGAEDFSDATRAVW
eukprot:g20017.t1